jgi:hypothetical protein
MAVRADVVALILDVRSMSDYPNLVRESTGLPLTPDEVALAGSAKLAEMKAVLDYRELEVDTAEADARDTRRMLEMSRPYFDQLGPDATMGDVEKLMTPVELVELHEIYLRTCPDGYIVLDGLGGSA